MTDKVLQNFDKNEFQVDLIRWFHEHKRDLPWRHTNDPYAIWVSEIMLQQTKVDTVIDYYNKFMKKYPTPFHLAEADEQEVLKQWEGLGYYSRARNLHHAVKEVVATYGGTVPKEKEALRKLKGIGPYTLGAIMSIAFQQPEPAVDGNVMRVMSRILLIKDDISEQKTKRLFEAIIRDIISYEDPSSFNQGLMEIGALICTPQSPKCSICPLSTHCKALKEQVQDQLPVKRPKKRQQTKHYIAMIVRDQAGKIAIEQRSNEGLLANLWQFPMVEFEKPLQMESLMKKIAHTYRLDVTLLAQVGTIKHIFSHLIWQITVFEISYENKQTPAPSLQFVTEDALEAYPLSVAHLKIKKMIRKNN